MTECLENENCPSWLDSNPPHGVVDYSRPSHLGVKEVFRGLIRCCLIFLTSIFVLLYSRVSNLPEKMVTIEIQTRGCWLRSINATFVLSSPSQQLVCWRTTRLMSS